MYPLQTLMPTLVEKPRPFTVGEYHAMVEAGILTEEDRVELLDGQIITMSPKGNRHAACVRRLLLLFGERLHIRQPPPAILSIQDPIRMNDRSEPEPDLALIRPELAQEDRHPGPEDVLLLVEVADTSLAYDRDVKVPRYAAAGIPEVWIVALTDGSVEVFRQPSAHGYRKHEQKHRGERLDVAALPDLGMFDVDAILRTPPTNP